MSVAALLRRRPRDRIAEVYANLPPITREPAPRLMHYDHIREQETKP